jgi:LysM repeat protein
MQSTRTSTSARRLGALVAPALIGAFVLSSCGGGETGATQSTIDLSAASTAFVVRPPATTVPTDTAGGEPGAIVDGTQEYEVQAGDAPFVLVSRFEVTLEDLLAVNEWTSANQFPFPGTVILIPPGGKSVAEYLAGNTASSGDTTTDTGSDGGSEGDSDSGATDTIPDAGDNCAPGSYTIAETDTTRTKVAEKFDVTVEALDAANAGTPGYSAFYPGLEIVIPAKADC